LPVSPVMFASASDEWSTPQDLFYELNREFNFGVDLAASPENTKCEVFYSKEASALVSDWGTAVGSFGGTAGFCNPPYSRLLQGAFIGKAARERQRGFLTVMLLPARTDTKSFHAFIWDAEKHKPREGVEIRFIKGRLKFGGAVNSAPFPSMIVIFRPGVS
jgi:phage N-6-adenine-methyltransferase